MCEGEQTTVAIGERVCRLIFKNIEMIRNWLSIGGKRAPEFAPTFLSGTKHLHKRDGGY